MNHSMLRREFSHRIMTINFDPYCTGTCASPDTCIAITHNEFSGTRSDVYAISIEPIVWDPGSWHHPSQYSTGSGGPIIVITSRPTSIYIALCRFGQVGILSNTPHYIEDNYQPGCLPHPPSSRFPRCRSVSSGNTSHPLCQPTSTRTHQSCHPPTSPPPRETTR